MKNKFYLTLFIIAFVLCSSTGYAQVWTTISTDTAGDGFNPSLIDGTQFDYSYDQSTDSIWFRLLTDTITSLQEDSLGVNVLVRTPGALNTFNFWGMDNHDPFDLLLTTWVTGAPPTNYSGTIGISDAAGVGMSDYASLSSNNISINVDVNNSSIVLGLKRSDLIADSAFIGSDTITVVIQAAVGSNSSWNDDIYSPTATMTVIRNTTGINPVASNSEIKIYLNSVTHVLNIDFGNIDRSNTKIVLTGITGNLIKKIENVNSTVYNLNVSDLANGIFFISVSRGNNVLTTRKIVID